MIADYLEKSPGYGSKAYQCKVCSKVRSDKSSASKNVENFFLLDVEFPYIYQNSSTKTDFLSTRFSKYESIESVENLINKVSWLWVDTYDNFRIDSNSADIMKNFKIAHFSQTS